MPARQRSFSVTGTSLYLGVDNIFFALFIYFFWVLKHILKLLWSVFYSILLDYQNFTINQVTSTLETPVRLDSNNQYFFGENETNENSNQQEEQNQENQDDHHTTRTSQNDRIQQLRLLSMINSILGTDLDIPSSNSRLHDKAMGVVPFLCLIFFKVFSENITHVASFIALFSIFVSSNQFIVDTMKQGMVTINFARRISVYLFFLLVWSYCSLGIDNFLLPTLTLNVMFYFDAENMATSYVKLFIDVFIVDHCVKMVTVFVKAMIIILEYNQSVTRTRNLLDNCEKVSQVVRCCFPILPWLKMNMGGSIWDLMVIIGYFFLKVMEIAKYIRQLEGVSLGRDPSPEDNVDDMCGICRDKLNEPIVLWCTHAFCTECITTWADEHLTCPYCRHSIPRNTVCYKDGATASTFRMW